MESYMTFYLRGILIRWLGLSIKVREEKREGWKSELPIYRFFCKECNSFKEDYSHGFSYRLDCPDCN